MGDRRVYGLILFVGILFPIVLSDKEQLSSRECEDLGFTGLALCSDCNTLAEYVKDKGYSVFPVITLLFSINSGKYPVLIGQFMEFCCVICPFLNCSSFFFFNCSGFWMLRCPLCLVILINADNSYDTFSFPTWSFCWILCLYQIYFVQFCGFYLTLRGSDQFGFGKQ